MLSQARELLGMHDVYLGTYDIYYIITGVGDNVEYKYLWYIIVTVLVLFKPALFCVNTALFCVVE